jgi:hypothetical protein
MNGDLHAFSHVKENSSSPKYRLPKPITRNFITCVMLEDETHTYIATTLADGLHVINKKTGSSKQFPCKSDAR